MNGDAGPIVYVDRSAVRAGKWLPLQRAIGDLAALVKSSEPQILAYAAFLDAHGETLTVIHVHADAASLERHFEIVAPALPPFTQLLELRSIDVYGQPTEATLGRLHAKAALLGGSVTVHALAAGFARSVTRSPLEEPAMLEIARHPGRA
jgi:hypothetical protein